MLRVRTALVCLAISLASATTASAYTAYLKPADFSPDGDASAQLAFTTQFFDPQVAVDASNLTLQRPNGERTTFASLSVAGRSTDFQVALTENGTYRLSSGEVLGQVATMALIDDQWRPVAAGEVLPEGTETTTLQTVTLAEAYVYKRWPSDEILAQPIGQLAFCPITNPNLVSVASGFDVQLQFGGAPLGNMAIVVNEAGQPETDQNVFFATDENGRAKLTFDHPGVYVATVRYRADAPPGSEAAVRSYTTTLTFEVLAQLPEPPPPERESRRRRRSSN